MSYFNIALTFFLMYINHSPSFPNIFFHRSKVFCISLQNWVKVFDLSDFSKFYPIFFESLKTVCIYSVSCRYGPLFILSMGEWKNFLARLILWLCVRCLTSVFADYFIHIFFIMSLLVCFRWLNSSVGVFCQRWRKFYVSDLIADCFCAEWWCDSI